MLIGIISDTHGYLHPSVHTDFAGVDLILHAGDVGRVEIIDELSTIAPVRGVFGNVDGMDIRRIWPEHDRFELEGMQFWMTHIGGRPGRYDSMVAERLKSDPPDVFICGHSHILRIERDDKLGRMLFINPGAAGRQGLHRVKTCVRLRLSNGAAEQAEVVHLDPTP
ncbi:MAG: metallophosphoesterase family protein [Rhodothermales bacterium]|nr:metallophosphoesterase family protein [Rhodothermales bacterium]